MIMSFIIGCVDRMFIRFFQDVSSFFSFSFLSTIVLASSLWIFDLSLPVGDKFL